MVFFRLQAAWCYSMGRATGHGGSLSAKGRHGAADAGSLGPPPRSSARAARQPSSQPQSRAYGEPSDAAPHAKSQGMLAGASGAAPLDDGGAEDLRDDKKSSQYLPSWDFRRPAIMPQHQKISGCTPSSTLQALRCTGRA
eukprot:scaffold2718_cov103-Isochrysis_galbana.AAC.14